MDSVEKKKLSWRCRRGMRELDIILETYLSTRYNSLSRPEKVAFQNFLEENDLEIMSWIMGKSAPRLAEYDTLITDLTKLMSKD